ncbi:MAG: tRNA (adenosine(37)-N6)-threonylcarbamoyltransferase complex ATPase subunit type 1 TsaE [Gammaproteobacteria bacterium WSBS_2016_MAG_OTU1]
MQTIEHATTAPSQTIALAQRFATTLGEPPLHVHLHGDLGAGKTLWARALIAALGGGEAQSPSFAWALSYSPPSMLVHHIDLFRLSPGTDLPDELLELLQEDALCLIEWPSRTALPTADIFISLDFTDDGRRLKFRADSQRGNTCLRAFA